MLMVQERAGRPKSPWPMDADISRVNDDSIEGELVSLLGQLDFLREKMMVARNAGSLGPVLSFADELLKHLSVYANQQVLLRSSMEMKTAEAKANEYRSLASQHNEQSQETFGRQALLALPDAVMAYFAAFTRRFSTSLAARSWVDVAATFIVELQQVPPAVMQPQ